MHKDIDRFCFDLGNCYNDNDYNCVLRFCEKQMVNGVASVKCDMFYNFSSSDWILTMITTN